MNCFLFRCLFFFLGWQCVYAQSSCETSTSFTPSTKNQTIDWQKFPEFSLPFTLAYAGPRFGDTQQLPLKHGFSHLSTFNGDDNLPKGNRAVIWYGVAGLAGQPWNNLKSPWNNDLAQYKAKWSIELKNYANTFADTRNTNVFDADLLLLDVESQIKSNDSILVLKNNPQIPAQYRSLDNQSFIKQYKQDLQSLYALPIDFTKTNFATSTTKISSYADTPIPNTFTNIAGNSWQKWTTDVSLLNYLTTDFSTNKVGGSFYQKQDYLTPSAYYYYDYPNPLASDYLAYLLFQIEANKAWSDKKIIPFVWLRYSASGKAYDRKFIQPFMAEATAIFPFFSGANGLWLWDDPTLFNNDESFATYEYFINGLYRLSSFKDMFSGSYELVIPTPAREYVDTQKPIWRGVVNGDNILVAAQNPYAADDKTTTTLTASYKNWSQNITLTGRQVFLCKFSLKTLATEENNENWSISPNPTSDNLSLKFTTNQKDIALKITDLSGKIYYSEMAKNEANVFAKILKINDLSSGIYLVEMNDGKQKFVKKIIKN